MKKPQIPKVQSYMRVVGDITRANAKIFPNKVGFVYRGDKFTWQEVDNRVNSLANAILDLGLRKGDKCGILNVNSHRYMELLLALAKTGIVAVTLNPRLTGKEMAYMLNETEAKALFVVIDYNGIIEPVRSQLKSVKHVIGIGQEHGYPQDYEKLITKYPPHDPQIEIEEEDLWRIVYTGGTTGLPKGAMCSHRNSMCCVMSLAFALRQQPSDVWGACTAHLCLVGQPLYTLSYMSAGCTIVFDDYEPQRFVDLLEEEKITAVVLVPIMANYLYEKTNILKRDRSHVRKILYGASPMPVEWIPLLREMFPNAELQQGYGTTEGNLGTIHMLPEEHQLAEEEYRKGKAGNEKKANWLRSIGRPAVGVDARVVDDNDNELPRGQIGELVIRSGMVMEGYWKQPEMTAEALKNNWLHVGDMGYMDEDGFIYLVDRKKDMIISGGFNIYSKEVENMVNMHPAVDEVAVIGVPDKIWGEAVKAIVRLKPGMTATEDEIIKFCKQSIASFKAPKSIEFVEEFPRTALGKIKKRELREKYWAGYETRISGGGEKK